MTTRINGDNNLRQIKLSAALAKSFLKWAGGKQQLLGNFERYFPRTFCNYYEPFLGSGAVYFHLWNNKSISDKAYLFDNNAELINTYRVVRDNVDKLIEILANHERLHSRKYYYKIRALDRNYIANLSDVEKAARTIYLNRTCYNGLYRVNSKGQFNVPIGSYKNPKVLHESTLRAAFAALQGVYLETRDYQTILDLAERGDFIYLDPPYNPISKTASFTSYTANGFREKDQRKLADVFTKLSEKGCLCMLSNSFTPFMLDLYRGFRIETVLAIRAINSDANGRGAINEIVVLNY